VSIILLDPHGQSAERCKKFDLSKKYFERLVYIDPFLKPGFTPCLNPLQVDDISLDNVELHTQHLIEVFQELIPDKLSTYMKAILTPCISLLLLEKNCSLKDLQDMMNKKKCIPRVEK